MAIVDASYTNLVPAFGGGYSYAFDGQWGSLDHALANASLRSQVTSARDWFINADEPTVLDYNTNFKSPGQVLSLYAPDRFRMSDHNPLAVDLDLISPSTPRRQSTAGSWCWEHPRGGGWRSRIHRQLRGQRQVQEERHAPDGHATLIFHRTESDGVLHTYQVKATTISTFLRSVATGEALRPRPPPSPISAPENPIVVHTDASLRATLDDNGNPASSPIPSE